MNTNNSQAPQLPQTAVSKSAFSLSLDNLENEDWIDALGFDGVYQVSNFGRVKTLGRWVSNGKSERWVKERIRKLVLVKDGRISIKLNYENKAHSINLSAIIYFSFNPHKDYLNRSFCVMHKNKIQHDNRLINLELTTVSKSHTTNHNHGLLEHLHNFNKNRTLEYQKLTHKTCKMCKENKEIKLFEFGRNTCMSCRKILKKQEYIKRKLSEQTTP